MASGAPGMPLHALVLPSLANPHTGLSGLPKRLSGLMRPSKCRITAKVAVKDGTVPFGCCQAYGRVPHRFGCAPSRGRPDGGRCGGSNGPPAFSVTHQTITW